MGFCALRGLAIGRKALVKAIVATAALPALLGLAVAIWSPAIGTGQEGLSIGVDADPAGNTATSLGTIDSCVRVGKGDSFDIDLFITNVDDLLGWEVYLSFDGDVVNVTDRDVKLFQAANANSDVFDASESLPSSGGLYRLGAADIGQPPSPDSGSGVLARLTLEAVGAGLSPATITTLDVDNDGKIDLGPQLSTTRGEPVGDTNGDGFFDGPLLNAQIAVDRDCPSGPVPTTVTTLTVPAPSPTQGSTPLATVTSTAMPAGTAETARPSPSVASAGPSPSSTPSDEDNGTNWTSGGFIVAYVVIGAVVAVLLGGGAYLATTRRRGAP
jgi:hypothetical protein